MRVIRDRDVCRRNALVGHPDKTLGGHADDGARNLVNANRLPDHVGRAAELCLPERMPENRHRLAGRHAVVGRVEEPAMHGPRIEELEVAGTGDGHAHLARVRAVADRQLTRLERRDHVGGLCCPEKIAIDREGQVAIDAPLAVVVIRGVDAVRQVRVPERGGRTEQQPVDDPEHRGIRAQPEA